VGRPVVNVYGSITIQVPDGNVAEAICRTALTEGRV
jgi:hypothetical protein